VSLDNYGQNHIHYHMNILLPMWNRLSQTQLTPLRHITVFPVPPIRTAKTPTVLTSTATPPSSAYRFPVNPFDFHYCKVEMNDSTMRISQHHRF